jgi:hypothetical protein
MVWNYFHLRAEVTTAKWTRVEKQNNTDKAMNTILKQ